MGTYVEVIQFVCSEIRRFLGMDPRDALRLPFPENFATLPHPSGSGSILCGGEAYKRLREMARVATERSQYAGRLNSESVFRELRSVLVQRFLKEGREITKREAGNAISAAIKLAANSCCDLTHFIPCHLGGSRSSDEFAIGPVKFISRAKVLERLEPTLELYVEQEQIGQVPVNRANLERLLANAREYYNSFDWIAEIVISGCDPTTSRRRAKQMVQNAIDCLHALIGASHSRYMRAGGPNFRTDRRGQIEIDANGRADISISTNWLSNLLDEDWWGSLNRNGGGDLLELMGVAIEAGNDLSGPAPIAQRFLDAAAWYGEAVRDEFSASSLVKYVTSMERILVTSRDKGVTRTFVERGSALISVFNKDSLNVLRKRFDHIYDVRSCLVHGSRSPIEGRLGRDLHEAEQLARLVILSALIFFRQDGLRTKSIEAEKLEEAYSRLIECAKETSL